jgi:hypothetical protein
MPLRKEHELLSIMLLGDSYSHVHAVKDHAARYLGKRHRIVAHGLVQDLILAGLLGWGPKELLAAILHDVQDGAL